MIQNKINNNKLYKKLTKIHNNQNNNNNKHKLKSKLRNNKLSNKKMMKALLLRSNFHKKTMKKQKNCQNEPYLNFGENP